MLDSSCEYNKAKGPRSDDQSQSERGSGPVKSDSPCWHRIVAAVPKATVVKVTETRSARSVVRLQVAVEKFARYFDVETKVINVDSDGWVMRPEDAVKACDENTIGIFAIVGTTYTGHFEDIKGMNDLLEDKNRETG